MAKQPKKPPKPCERCLEALDTFVIRYEGVQPLRGGALDALDYNNRPHCQDCDFSERMVRMGNVPTWGHARTALSNHRQESMRLPELSIGLGRVGARLSKRGEFDKHLEWLDENVMVKCEIEGVSGHVRMCQRCRVKTPHYNDTGSCLRCVSRAV